MRKGSARFCIWTIMQSLNMSLHVQSRGIAINQIHILFQYRKLFDLTINQNHIFFQYRKRFDLTFLYIILQTEKSSHQTVVIRKHHLKILGNISHLGSTNGVNSKNIHIYIIGL
jgi:hypothetical protein